MTSLNGRGFVGLVVQPFSALKYFRQ